MINKNKCLYKRIRSKKSFKTIVNLTLIFSLLLTSFSSYALGNHLANETALNAENKIGDIYVSAEEVSKRGEFEKHYLLSDGSFMAVSYPEAIHYLTEDGTWEEVDNQLTYDNASARIVNGTDNFEVSFADSPTYNTLASISHNGKDFSWGLTAEKIENGKTMQLSTYSASKADIVSAKNSSLTTKSSGKSAELSASPIGKKISDADTFSSEKLNGKLSYDKIFDNAPELSVQYSVYHNKIEEDIYINSPTNLRTFTMNIQAGTLVACLNDDGSVDFVDENGVMQYRIGIPYMQDANNEVLNDITVTVEQNEEICTVKYTPNEEWLTSDERAYPILLDPSITTKEYNSNIADTYVYEGNTANHSAEQRLYYGVKSGKIYRTYIKINNLPNIDAHMPIISATMQLTLTSDTTTGKTVQVYKASSSWNPSTITYANQPALVSSNLLATCNYNASVFCLSFDLSQDVGAIYDEFQAAVNYGYVVKYADESNTNPDYNVFHSIESTTTAKRPLITITYGYALPTQLINGGIYSFQNYGTSSYMTVHGLNDANDTNVNQQSISSSAYLGPQHKFKLEYVASTGGYYLRSMCSSNGTNRVLDVVKSGGYVNNGGNVQIYDANDPLAQHWFIIGTGVTTFKIVPRTNMSLAITVCPGGDGTATGTATTSVGNIFVSTYSDTNDYQKWMIRDDAGNFKFYEPQNVEDATYYINNLYYGKYLHKSSQTAIDAVSGLISTYEDTIRWKVTHVGNDQYTIQPTNNLSKYLRASGSSGATLASMASFTNEYLWTIEYASGGGKFIKNVATQKYLKQTGTSTVSLELSLPAEGTSGYEMCCWRIASTDYYGNNKSTSSTYANELRSGFTIQDLRVDVGETTSPNIIKFPVNTLWASPSDFYYSTIPSATESSGSFTGLIKSSACQVTATHKLTGLTMTFTVTVSNLLVYQTRNRERMGNFINENDITPKAPEDLQYGQKSITTLTSNGTLISYDDFYENGSLIPISKRITTIRNLFYSQISYDSTFTVILDEMLDHFLDGSGTDYSSENLTNAVKTHQNTTNFVNDVIQLVDSYLSQNNGDISGLYYDEDLWVQPTVRNLHPLISSMRSSEYAKVLPTYGLNNGVPGLSLAINGWYGCKIEIESFATANSAYSGTMRFVFYDHFGLNTEDLSVPKEFDLLAGIMPGFRQWFILQHWDSLDAEIQPKPFLTLVSYTVSFSGTY